MSISHSSLDTVRNKSNVKCDVCGEYKNHATYDCSEEYQTWIEEGYHCVNCAKKKKKRVSVNLYMDIITTFCQKDHWETTDCYFLAENEEEAFKKMDDWYDFQEYYESDLYSDKGIKKMTLRNKGWDKEDWPDDLYYGATRHNWKLIKEDVTEEEIKVLRRLGIIPKEE